MCSLHQFSPKSKVCFWSILFVFQNALVLLRKNEGGRFGNNGFGWKHRRPRVHGHDAALSPCAGTHPAGRHRALFGSIRRFKYTARYFDKLQNRTAVFGLGDSGPRTVFADGASTDILSSALTIKKDKGKSTGKGRCEAFAGRGLQAPCLICTNVILVRILVGKAARGPLKLWA